MIPEFAIRLIFGLAVMWWLAPRKEITSGFFRIQMLITLGLSVLLFLTVNQFDTERFGSGFSPTFVSGLAIAIGGLSFLGSMYWTLERRNVGEIIGFIIAVFTGVGVGYLAWNQSVFFPSWEMMIVLWQCAEAYSSAFLFGATTATMLLGHWYLTATGMSLNPLVRMSRLLIGAVIVRIVVSVASAFDGSQFIISGSWGLQILRLAGLVAPLLLGILNLQILKYRNTQSATGVLYAATILVFMGEMAAQLLQQTMTSTVL